MNAQIQKNMHTQSGEQNWEERYQGENNRLQEVSRTEPVQEFSRLVATIRKTWEDAPGYWYGNIMLCICGLYQTAYLGQPGTKEAVWELAAAALSAPDKHLSFETEVRLLYYTADEPLQNNSAWPSVRMQRATWWLRVWKRIDTETDSRYDATDMPALNVSPPQASGLPPGVDPASIDNHAWREAYNKTIEENRIKAVYYNQQYTLRRLGPEFKKTATMWLTDWYTKKPPAIAEIKDLLAAWLPHYSEADAILDIINERMAH